MITKKGLSQVVSTVILIALTIVLVGGTFTLVRNYVTKSLDDTSACNNILEKISLNKDYTCFDSKTNSTLISISRNEFVLDSLLVSVAYEERGTTFYLSDIPTNIQNLTYYGDLISTEVQIPGNESGKTYCLSGTYPAPSRIEIAPKRSGKQCNIVDSIQDIPTCAPDLTCS